MSATLQVVRSAPGISKEVLPRWAYSSHKDSAIIQMHGPFHDGLMSDGTLSMGQLSPEEHQKKRSTDITRLARL